MRLRFPRSSGMLYLVIWLIRFLLGAWADMSFSSEGTYESSPTSVTYIGNMWFKIWKLLRFPAKRELSELIGFWGLPTVIYLHICCLKWKHNQFYATERERKRHVSYLTTLSISTITHRRRQVLSMFSTDRSWIYKYYLDELQAWEG